MHQSLAATPPGNSQNTVTYPVIVYIQRHQTISNVSTKMYLSIKQLEKILKGVLKIQI